MPLARSWRGRRIPFQDVSVRTAGRSIPLRAAGRRVAPRRRATSSWHSKAGAVENRVAPGGHFGWHSHPGPSLVIVKSGTATFYRGDDPTCTPKVYEQGDAFADPTGGIVHIVRNEGSQELVVIVTRLLQPGTPARTTPRTPATVPSITDYGLETDGGIRSALRPGFHAPDGSEL